MSISKKIVRVPVMSTGDVFGYSMIEFHTDFTETMNKLLKSNNIDFKLKSTSFGGEYDDDWRVLFELNKVES